MNGSADAETITLYLVGIVAFIVGATVLHFMEWDSVLFYSIALGGIAGFDVMWVAPAQGEEKIRHGGWPTG